MARVLGHRQTKEAATDNPNLMSPRHIPTLHVLTLRSIGRWPEGAGRDLATGIRLAVPKFVGIFGGIDISWINQVAQNQ
jgi:hypothetical protein